MITGYTGLAGTSTVAAGTRNIAHIGRLFYSPGTANNPYQSIFFPAAGQRTYSTGTLSNVGVQGYYHLTAAHLSGNNYLFYLQVSSTDAMMYLSSSTTGNVIKNIAFPIRCVK